MATSRLAAWTKQCRGGWLRSGAKEGYVLVQGWRGTQLRRAGGHLSRGVPRAAIEPRALNRRQRETVRPHDYNPSTIYSSACGYHEHNPRTIYSSCFVAASKLAASTQQGRGGWVRRSVGGG